MRRTNPFSFDNEPDCDDSDRYPNRHRFNYNCPDQDGSPCGSCSNCEEAQEEEEDQDG